MNKSKFLIFAAAAIIITYMYGCTHMFSTITGKDHLGEKNYKFLLFDSLNSNLLYGGYFELKNVGDIDFSGDFKIIDVFYEKIPIGNGKVEGKQNEGRDAADMLFKSDLAGEYIEIKLISTWDIIKGNWSYKSIGGKFIAFENN